jgi:SAM-dependent methyltransferase
MELLLGCGSKRDNQMGGGWTELVTVDLNPDHRPDVVADLSKTPWPFPDDAFDEVHAYEVLEHLGQQGDYVAFFAQFSEIWRILKPGGMLYAKVPSWDSPWLWGDPSHSRAILPETLVFLSQAEYDKQVGVTPMSDFRYLYEADFQPVWLDVAGGTFSFVLRVIK